MSELADLLGSSTKTVFFCGAGVSTESGIPDFRSSTGVYTTNKGGKYPPEYLLSHSCFVQHNEDFYDFYLNTMLYPDAKPNPAHEAMAWFEQNGYAQGVVTQNIDGLHQVAGSKNVVELHGSSLRNYCMDCGEFYTMQDILQGAPLPKCQKCGGLIKPDVVLYEESLNMEAIEKAVSMISTADCLVVGGTSLNVYPAAGLIQYYRGQKLVLINRDPTNFDRHANPVLHQPIGEVLAKARALVENI